MLTMINRIKNKLLKSNALDEPGTAEILAAKLLIEKMKEKSNVKNLHDVEFKVFSQWGDDGIIQYLIHHLDLNNTFIEFGVQDYTESNTRFLLMNNNWSGLVMDSNPEYIQTIQKSKLYWQYDLTAVEAFINRDNINALIQDNGFQGEIGILNIDIDGNDYYVWEAISVVNPAIVICEYNALFGWRHAVSIPYDPLFTRQNAHYSYQYYGASLKALWHLADTKDYALVGCNSNGNNAYFVRKDKLGHLQSKTPVEAYVQSKFRDSRDPQGRLSYVGGEKRVQLIEDLDVYHVIDKKTVKFKQLVDV